MKEATCFYLKTLDQCKRSWGGAERHDVLLRSGGDDEREKRAEEQTEEEVAQIFRFY